MKNKEVNKQINKQNEKTVTIKKNQDYTCEITGVTFDGKGICRVDNFTVFVPNTAIGDLVLIKILKVLKSYAFGKVLEIITPSKDRILPDCDIYNQCGGCVYRHISYDSELLIKQDLVVNAFLRIGKIDIPCENIVPAKIERYRNKAQYPIGLNENNKAISGFYATHSHNIISCTDCKLQPKEFSQIQADILNFIDTYKISIYNEETCKGLLRHIYLRKADFTNEIMVCLVSTNENIPQINELIEKLTTTYTNIKSIVININKSNTNVILGKHCKTIFGLDYINDEICSIKVKLSALSFYQVNKIQAEKLYNLALEKANLNSDDILIDLYCGTGTIGLIASNKVKKVIGVEIISEAIENAKQNAIDNKIVNAEFICGDAKTATQKLVDDKIKPNVIIVDPPRKGLDVEVINAISEMNPDRLVMVSCNPSTAARDCLLLAEKGFFVKSITPVDMFPRTGHVECVVLMTKNKQEKCRKSR